MVELLKKLRDNDVEMSIMGSYIVDDFVRVKFSKHPEHEYHPIKCYATHIGTDEIEASRLSFEQIVLVHLDEFLNELGKEMGERSDDMSSERKERRSIDIPCQNT